MDEHKDAFAAATSEYFSTLSSLDVRLRRQIYALEEVNILPAEVSSKDAQTNLVALGASDAGGGLGISPTKLTNKGAITGGGLGSLDVGWLNSRNDDVGKEKDAELWELAQRFVEDLDPTIIDRNHSTDAPNQDDNSKQGLPQRELNSEPMQAL